MAPGSFLESYLAGATEAQDIVLETSVLGEPLRLLAEEAGSWQGTATDLLQALKSRAGEELSRAKEWPKSGRGMSGALRRLAPTLRSIGVEVEFGRETNTSRRRTIVIRQAKANATVQTVQPSGLDDLRDERLDGSDGADGYEPPPSDALDDAAVEVAWEIEVTPA